MFASHLWVRAAAVMSGGAEEPSPVKAFPSPAISQVGKATLEPAAPLQSWCLESRSVGEGSSAHCSPYCVGWQVVRSHQQRRRWAMIYLLLHECHGVGAPLRGIS